MNQSSERHRWILADDLKVLFIYLHEVENTSFSMEEIAELIGVPVSKVEDRIEEFRGIEGNSARFTHSCYETRYVLDKYRNLEIDALRNIAFYYHEKIKE
ncbi:MAG: hypothetical protein AB4372_16340 [Xenococcus sp. (in: cyanobacteria)]